MPTPRPSNNGHHQNGQQSQQENTPSLRVRDRINSPLRELQEWINDEALTEPCPFPSPQELAEYEKILPGSGKEILELAQKGQWLRERKNEIKGRIFRRILTSSIICTFTLVGATIMGILVGYPWHIVVPMGICGSIPFVYLEAVIMRK